MNIPCKINKRNLNCITSKRTESYFLWQHIDHNSKCHPVSASPCHLFFYCHSPFFCPFLHNNFRLERLAVLSYEAWLDKISFTGWETVSTFPPSIFDQCPWNSPEGCLQTFDVHLKTIVFRLDLIQVFLSCSKLIPPYKVARKHHFLILTLQYVCTFLMQRADGVGMLVLSSETSNMLHFLITQ